MGTVDGSERGEVKSTPPDSPRTEANLRKHGSSLEQYPVTPAAHKFLQAEKLNFDQRLRRHLVEMAIAKTAEVGKEGSLTENELATSVQLTLAEVQAVVIDYRKNQEAGKERHQELYDKRRDETVPAELLDEKGRVTCGCRGRDKFQPTSWNKVVWKNGKPVIQTIQNGPDARKPQRNGNFVVTTNHETHEAIVIALSRDCHAEYARQARAANPDADVRQMTYAHAERIAYAINRQATEGQERRKNIGDLASGAISRPPRNRMGSVFPDLFPRREPFTVPEGVKATTGPEGERTFELEKHGAGNQEGPPADRGAKRRMQGGRRK